MRKVPDFEYVNLRRIRYRGKRFFADGDMQFVPVCPKCGRYVITDAVYHYTEGTVGKCDNATCSQCGRVQMPFEGYFGEEE